MKELLHAGLAVLGARFLNKKSPAIVSWSLTDKCDRHCVYCNRWESPQAELNTEEVFSVLNQLSDMKTRIIIFTGGEPFVRQDLKEIINYAHNKGIYTMLHTNAGLLSRRAGDIRNLDKIIFCILGPRKVNDSLRGDGAYDNVLSGIEIARSYGVKVGLLTVLCRQNLDSFEHVLDLSKSFDVRTVFQPLVSHLLNPGNACLVLPAEEQYRKAVHRLISLKMKGDRHINNSLSGLKHLLLWPDPVRVKCPGGFVYCRIDAKGDISYCDRPVGPEGANVLKNGLSRSFSSLVPRFCDSCWCAMRVELGNCIKLDMGCLFNFLEMNLF
ncbi:MAG: radical SAM protein [Candidatus Omnitrophica bacterium]|nr:radical SAM protein [Candidatus Omnitrophota bacterium]